MTIPESPRDELERMKLTLEAIQVARESEEIAMIAMRIRLTAMTAARDELADLAEEANGDPGSCSYNVPLGDRVIELRKVGKVGQ